MSDKHHTERELSTTALAKEIKNTPQELFQQLFKMGLLVRKDNTWELTANGQAPECFCSPANCAGWTGYRPGHLR